MIVVFTRHTLVWQGTKFAVFLTVSGYSYLGNGGTDRREILQMVHIGPGQIFSPFGSGSPRESPKSNILHNVQSTLPLIFIARQHTNARY